MKKTKIMLMLGVLFFALASCEKETGPAGPIGPQGPVGADGNANILVFNFSRFTISDATPYHTQMFALNHDVFNQSMAFAYVGYIDYYQELWYAIPGITVDGMNEYRSFYRLYEEKPDSTDFTMRRISGVGNDAIDSLRIIIIPAAMINTKSAEELPDWRDYQAVMAYYGIKK